MRTSCCPVSPIPAPHYLLLSLLPLFITPTLYKSPVRIPAFSNTPSPHSHSQASQPPAPPPRLQPPTPPHPAMTHPGNIPKGPPHPPPPSISHPLWMTSFEVNYKFSKTMLRFCFIRAGISFKSCRFWGLWENSGFSWWQRSSVSPSQG